MRDVGATLNAFGRYRNSVFAIFERVVSPRNPSGPGLKFLLPGLSVCKISTDTFFKILFGCSSAFDNMNNKITYSGLAPRIYVSPFYYSETETGYNRNLCLEENVYTF